MASGGVDRSGEVLGGRYQLVRRIGTGGMGAVYEAIQSDLGRRVAVKVLHTHLSLEPTLLERFRREALAAAALGHPNIVSVSDLQSLDGGPPFLVMELLTGQSLREAIVADKRIEASRVAFIASQVLSALAAAHAERIVHRDVKPDNIVLIDTTALRDFVKVLDFGVAKLQRDNVEGLTVAGAILGTLSYMAPEQARGHAVDGRADVYSVGACMYHALSGTKPFERKSRAELFAAVVMEAPTPLVTLVPGLDVGLAAIVERAMEKKAADRYESADAMVRELVTWLKRSGSVGASLPPPGSRRSPSLAPVTPTEVPTVSAVRVLEPLPVGLRPGGEPVLPLAATLSEGDGARVAAATPTPKRAPLSKADRSRWSLGWVVVVSVVVGVALERIFSLLTGPAR